MERLSGFCIIHEAQLHTLGDSHELLERFSPILVKSHRVVVIAACDLPHSFSLALTSEVTAGVGEILTSGERITVRKIPPGRRWSSSLLDARPDA